MRLLLFATALVVVVSLASSCWATEVAPLAMTNSAIGGGALNQYTPGIDQGVGVNNIGLLIKTWGKVTFVDTTNKFFYIDDGYGRLDGSGRKGIRCSYDNLAPGVPAITPPAQDAYVSVIGVISTVMISTKVQPNIRPRRGSDIVPQ